MPRPSPSGLNDFQARSVADAERHANPDEAAAASTDFMHMFGLVALAYMWAMMARKAQAKLAERRRRPGVLREQARDRCLFHAAGAARDGPHLARISTGAESMMALDAEAF
jgi:acyl-CoA dehydrogenase